jgi:hypothetical protein
VTPSAIEPAAFRLVAHCPNKLRHRLPHNKEDSKQNKKENSIRKRERLIARQKI